MARRLKHLEVIHETYFEHLFFALKVAFVLVVHGFMPWVWSMKASDMMEMKELERREKIRRGRSGYE
jgi:hypothetical protein